MLMPTGRGLQKELEVLIGSGQIQARIDSHNKVLYAKRTDQRNATFLAALRAGQLRVPGTAQRCLRTECSVLRSTYGEQFHGASANIEVDYGEPGEDCVRESKSLLLRASLLQHDLVQRGSAAAPFPSRGPSRPVMPERA